MDKPYKLYDHGTLMGYIDTDLRLFSPVVDEVLTKHVPDYVDFVSLDTLPDMARGVPGLSVVRFPIYMPTWTKKAAENELPELMAFIPLLTDFNARDESWVHSVRTRGLLFYGHSFSQSGWVHLTPKGQIEHKTVFNYYLDLVYEATSAPRGAIPIQQFLDLPDLLETIRFTSDYNPEARKKIEEERLSVFTEFIETLDLDDLGTK